MQQLRTLKLHRNNEGRRIIYELMLYYFELLHPGTIIEEIVIAALYKIATAALLKNRICSIIDETA